VLKVSLETFTGGRKGNQVQNTLDSGQPAMEFFGINWATCILLLSCALLPQQMKAEATGGGSLLFLDNPHHRFFRTESLESESEEISMTQSDVASTVSVLLGFAPSSTNPSVSSSKLDGLLLPNPFDRPRGVFMLDARGIDQELLSELDLPKLGLGAYSYRQLVAESSHTAVELPEDEVILESLNEASGDECDAHCIEQELVDLASWLGGSYTVVEQLLQGKFSIPLSKGSFLNLDLLKRADQIFAKELVSLRRNIRWVVSMHDLAEGSPDPALLLMGSFVGVQALREHYGQDDISREGLELFLNVAAKLLDSLQLSYGGQFVGVVVMNGNAVPASEGMFDVKLSSRTSRWLTEKFLAESNSTTAEVKLARRALAWSTAIILLIATLMGVYYLFNMPLTRDTLLYSNVKLD